MAYQGWLLKIGDYTVPDDKFIKPQSYKPYCNMQDLDPWTDANGYLHRGAVELKAIKVEFETPAMLTDETFEELMSNIRNNFVDPVSQGCYITAYIPFLNEYVTQYGYMVDIQPSIYGTYNGKIHYDSVRFAFVGGVYKGD